MKKIIKLLLFSIAIIYSKNSYTQLTTPPVGNNKKAFVGERIGVTDVVINYNRPGVKGREGKIYGTTVVHKGFIKPFIGTSKAAPWRAGANENTTISFSSDVKIDGKDLPAGVYGFFVSYDENECIVIFSKRSTSWGHFFYDEKEDALRVSVKPVKLEQNNEWLKYEFLNQTEYSANIALIWERLMISFKVEVDFPKTQIDLFRKELGNVNTFSDWQIWNTAADFCLQRTINLDEALTWSNQAIAWGGPNFLAYVTKVGVLKALGRPQEADSLRLKAFSLATMQQLHNYGRNLLRNKKHAEALEAFTYNAAKNPNQFIPLAGLIRGYSANGDYVTALKFAKEALPLAPDAANKKAIEDMIKKLADGKDVN